MGRKFILNMARKCNGNCGGEGQEVIRILPLEMCLFVVFKSHSKSNIPVL